MTKAALEQRVTAARVLREAQSARPAFLYVVISIPKRHERFWHCLRAAICVDIRLGQRDSMH